MKPGQEHRLAAADAPKSSSSAWHDCNGSGGRIASVRTMAKVALVIGVANSVATACTTKIIRKKSNASIRHCSGERGRKAHFPRIAVYKDKSPPRRAERCPNKMVETCLHWRVDPVLFGR